MQHWEVRNNLLTYVADDGTATVPTASFVYDALGYGTEQLEGVPNPSDDILDVRFSKRGARLAFEVEVSNEGTYVLKPCVTRLGRALDCTSLPIPVPEHYVCGDTWTYFSEGCEIANDSLAEAGISSFGAITLSETVIAFSMWLLSRYFVRESSHIGMTPIPLSRDRWTYLGCACCAVKPSRHRASSKERAYSNAQCGSNVTLRGRAPDHHLVRHREPHPEGAGHRQPAGMAHQVKRLAVQHGRCRGQVEGRPRVCHPLPQAHPQRPRGRDLRQAIGELSELPPLTTPASRPSESRSP